MKESFALDPAQTQFLANSFMNQFQNGNLVIGIFWGLWLIPFGLLSCKSGFIPKVIGAILVLGGTIPIESFVGREEQTTRLKKILGAKGGSRTLVYGDVGVGKTTFVNVIRAQAYNRGFFTPFKEIAVIDGWGVDEFITNTLGAFYTSCKLLGDKKPLSQKTYGKLEQLFEMVQKTLQVN